LTLLTPFFFALPTEHVLVGQISIRCGPAGPVLARPIRPGETSCRADFTRVR
jgi:hypothetical protein